MNKKQLIPGTIDHTIAHLILWGTRPLPSLAKVEFSSDFSRQKVVREITYQFKQKEIPFHEIKLPLREEPSVVFNTLFSALQEISSGVVSITGFETAFKTDIPLFEAVRVINFNRENLAQFDLRQIWWMSRPFHSEAIKVMPDFNSWFSLRLFLKEDASNSFVTVEKSEQHSSIIIKNNLPQLDNNFIARNEEFKKIAYALSAHDIVALSGIGGIGKSQLALQYAWQQQAKNNYPGGILWLNGLSQNLGIQIINFAVQYLNINVLQEHSLIERVRHCWNHWQEGKVLIIIDDVRDYEDIQPYLATLDNRFQVLITTRFNSLSSTIKTLTLGSLSETEAFELLELAIGKEPLEKELETAKRLCQKLNYFPLALDLVAQFLKINQDCSLDELLTKLQEQNLDLTKQDPTGENQVKAAFELSWNTLEIDVQTCAYYLSLLAFAPFSLSLIKKLFPYKTIEQINNNLTQLINYSLLQSLGKDQYELHTLIRRYLRDKLEASQQAKIIKRQYCKVMAHLCREIPETPTLENIRKITPYIPHIEIAAREFQRSIAENDIVALYQGLGRYYSGQGLYFLAEPWLVDCLTLTKSRLQERHPHVATSLNNLAELYDNQGRYTEAEPLYKQALDLRKELLGHRHPHVATSLNNLALLYHNQGKYTEVEPLYKQALDLSKEILGDRHPHVATSLNNLGGLYVNQGRYTEAELLYKQALALYKEILDHHHPNLATSLNNLGGLYLFQERYTEAEPLFKDALALRKEILGHRHPDTASSLNNLASLYCNQGRYTEAEPLFKEALALYQELLGDHHPHVAKSLNGLATLYDNQGRYTEAEPLFKQAVAIAEEKLGVDHPDTVLYRDNLTRFRNAQS